MELIEALSTRNDCYARNLAKDDPRYTQFQARGPLGLMLHSVGCAQPEAKVFAEYWNQPGLEVAVHAVIGAGGKVCQCLPWHFRGWHAGGSANDTHIGIEMTEPACLRYTGGASFTCSDLSAARAHCRSTYDTAVTLFALLCGRFGLNPMTAILSHAEGAAKGIASDHADPEHLWRGLGMDYTMEGFRRAVQAEMSSLYRVRRSRDDARSQLGAYRSRESAVKVCPPGYGVYDEAGNEVYRNPESALTRAQILTALGDRFIATARDLPDWARPEVQALLDLGLLNGGSDDPEAISMLLSDLRVAIVAYRAFRMLQKEQ